MKRHWLGRLSVAIIVNISTTSVMAQQFVPPADFSQLRTAATAVDANTNPAPVLLPAPKPAPSPAPAPATGPTSHGWPQPLVPTAPAPLFPSAPPPLLESPPSAFQSLPPGGPYILDAEGQIPLPGSLEENLNAEAAARRTFRYCTWNDYRITMFPQTLLWTPPLAEKRAPRLSATVTDFDAFGRDNTLDSSIGTTVGLLRLDTPGHDLAYQLDVFAVAHIRSTPQDIIATDYRFGIPLTWQWGDWHGKLAYERTQAHLGDDYLRKFNVPPSDRWVRNEAVFGLDRAMNGLRVYGTVSYAFSQEGSSDVNKKFRVDGGFEYIHPGATGFGGTPFVAAHVDAREVTGYNPNFVAQVGWLWRNPFQRLANARVYLEYSDGRSQFGQFAYNREKFYGLGVACDY